MNLLPNHVRTAAAFAVLLAAGCADDRPRPTIDPSGITETGFLRACDVDADCGEAGSCLCGVCSTPCGADDACGEAACVTADRAPACAPAGFCAARCDGDDDCGAGLACVDGACVGVEFAADAGAPGPDLGAPDGAPDAAPADAAPDADPPACVPGDCDDGDPCTEDRCEPPRGCKYPPVERFCVSRPVTCDDPLSLRFAGLLEATARTYEDRLSAGLLGGEPALEAATQAVRRLAVRASDLARRARGDCLTPEEVAAGLDALLPDQRIVADLLGEDERCRLHGYLLSVETALELSAALRVQWEATAWLAADVDALPEGNLSLSFARRRDPPLAPGEPFRTAIVVRSGLNREAGIQPIEIEPELGCAGHVEMIPPTLDLASENIRTMLLDVTLEDAGPCLLEVVATVRRNRTIRQRVRWMLTEGTDPATPPRLHPAYWGRARVPLEAARTGLVGLSALSFNNDDIQVTQRFEFHVRPDAVGAEGWTPTPDAPQAQTIVIGPGFFGGVTPSFRVADAPVGATGVVRLSLVAENDVPLDPPPTIDLTFEIVLGGAGCGTCEAADCDDGNACTEDACDLLGDCVNRHVAAYCVEGEATCDARDSLRFAELFEAMVRTYAQRLESAFESPPSPAGGAAVDAALRRLARVASLGGAHARTECLTEAEALAHLDRALGAQIDLYAAVDAAGGRLWAGVACDSAGALEDVVAALGAGDLEAAYQAEWRLLRYTAVFDDVAPPALPAGDVSVAFPTLSALEPPAPGVPLPLELEVLDRFATGGVPGRPHTFDVALGLDCAGWALDRDAATVVLTPGERARVPVVVTPGADSEACPLEVEVTLRENVGRGAALYRLPLRLGRRPAATRLSTGLGGRQRPYRLHWDGQRLASGLDVLLHNYDGVEHTYRLVREVVSDVEGFAVPDEPHDYRMNPWGSDRAPHEGERFPLSLSYRGEADPVGAEVAVRVTVTHVDGEPLPAIERQTVVQRAEIVASPPPCDGR